MRNKKNKNKDPNKDRFLLTDNHMTYSLNLTQSQLLLHPGVSEVVDCPKISMHKVPNGFVVSLLVTGEDDDGRRFTAVRAINVDDYYRKQYFSTERACRISEEREKWEELLYTMEYKVKKKIYPTKAEMLEFLDISEEIVASNLSSLIIRSQANYDNIEDDYIDFDEYLEECPDANGVRMNTELLDCIKRTIVALKYGMGYVMAFHNPETLPELMNNIYKVLHGKREAPRPCELVDVLVVFDNVSELTNGGEITRHAYNSVLMMSTDVNSNDDREAFIEDMVDFTLSKLDISDMLN